MNCLNFCEFFGLCLMFIHVVFINGQSSDANNTLQSSAGSFATNNELYDILPDVNNDGSVESETVDVDTSNSEDSQPVEDNSPPIGTELRFDMNTKSSGEGMRAKIYFTVQQDNALKMHCDVTAQAATPASRFWPDEFPSVDSVTGSDVPVDGGSNTTLISEDASIISSGRQTVNNGGNTRPTRTKSTCHRSMPHLYVLKDTSCCSDPSLSVCNCVEGKKLGCIEATGVVEHTFKDLSYNDLESYCLAITDKEVYTSTRTNCGTRNSKFISAGPSFFRTFGSLNFNSVSYLSSGTKTIAANLNTGVISVSYPSVSVPSISFSGGSSNIGFFDLLPYIVLEGLTVDFLYTAVLILMLTYTIITFWPMITRTTLLERISDPFINAGDFLLERMDVLEKTVKKSISVYHNKKRNSPQHAYDDADYYYDDEYYGSQDDVIDDTERLQRFQDWDQQWPGNYN